MSQSSAYDLKSVRLPRLAGFMLRAVVNLLENPLTRPLLLDQLLTQGGIRTFQRSKAGEAPSYLPAFHSKLGEGLKTAALTDFDPSALTPTRGELPFATVLDYASAYRAGSTTPEAVAERVLEAIEDSQHRLPAMNIMVAWDRDDLYQQAQQATRRISQGQALSVLDGVPVAVKDEVDMLPFPTRVGTRFLGRSPASQDATPVARLRAAGALLIGKTNMHEIGIGVTGLNPHFGTVRNPYDPQRHTGGSSSGPAAAVAAGFCPVALGADGGGSIRIPASFCGLVGLKPTFGRVSEYGAAPLAWSVAHIGPVAASALDAAIGYLAMSGPDALDPNSLRQPAVSLEGLQQEDLSGLRLGVFWPWFRHANPQVVEANERMLKHFEACGAQVREIEIPDLEAARVAHLITITSEMITGLEDYYQEHRKDYSLETRLNLSLAYAFRTSDYLRAQRIRTRLIHNLELAFQQVDAILTPTTAVTAPPIRADAQPDGESDLSLLTEIMRYCTPANLSGHPAISFPAGHDANGLPIGMQAIGRGWQEHVLLRLAYAAESAVSHRRPQVLYTPLD